MLEENVGRKNVKILHISSRIFSVKKSLTRLLDGLLMVSWWFLGWFLAGSWWPMRGPQGLLNKVQRARVMDFILLYVYSGDHEAACMGCCLWLQ